MVADLTNSVTYTYQVRAVNEYGTGRWSNSSKATPLANFAPEFGLGEVVTFEIAENTLPGGSVGPTVTATDFEGDNLIFSLTGPDASDFEIATSTVEIATSTVHIIVGPNTTLDFESATTTYYVTVSVHDGKDKYGNNSTSTDASINVTINVTNVNEAPTVDQGILDHSTDEDAAIVLSVPGNAFADVDKDDSLSYSAEVLPVVPTLSTGWLTLSEDGVFSGIPLNANVGEYTVTVSATDLLKAATSTSFLLTVVNTNDAPVAFPDFADVAEGGTLTVDASQSVLANDTDVDLPADTLTALLVEAPRYAASFTLNSDGTFSYTHDGSENHLDSFTYKLNDRNADSNIVTVSISITAVNDNAPVAIADSFTVDEGGAFDADASQSVLTNDTDVDLPAVTLTVSLIEVPQYAASFALNSDGTFSYTHDGSENHLDSFTYTASDGVNSSDEATVSISITAVNDNAPVANADSFIVDEGGTLTVDASQSVLTNDTDVDLPADTLEASLVDDPQYAASFTLNSDGTFSYTHDGSENHLDSFNYAASDGVNSSYEATVSISITAVNDNAPVANADSFTVDEGGTLTVDASQSVLTNDTDVDLPADTLTASLVEVPQYATSFALNSDGTFSYIHDGSENHLDSFTYTASDGVNSSNEATVSISITGVNDAPAFAGDVQFTVNENTAVGGRVGNPVTATDVDSSTLIYSLSGSGADSFDINTGNGQITVGAGATLDYESDTKEFIVTVSVHDGRDAYGNDDDTIDDSIEVTISVTNVDEAPVFTTAPSTVSYAENGSGAVANYDATDPEGSSIYWSLSGHDLAHFDIVDGVLYFVSPPDYESPMDRDEDNKYDVTIQASDGIGVNSLDVSLAVTVTVTNDDDPGTVSLSPSQPQVGTIITATLTDPDGLGSITSWQWARSTSRSTGWNDILGANSATYTPVRDDFGYYIRATALYEDGHDSGKSAAILSDNKVQAADTTNIAPTFGGDSRLTRAVAENTSVGGGVGSAVSATDKEEDTLIYSLSGDDASSFSIVNSNGQITVGAGATLDYESGTTEYKVTVSVHDGRDAYGNDDDTIDDSIEVTISVTNVDEAPVFTTAPSTVNYAENGSGQVANYDATDPESATIIWSLSGIDAVLFSIDEDGVLRFVSSPDYEAPVDRDEDNKYDVTIQASDGTGEDSLKVSQDVVVTVTNDDDPGTVSLSPSQPQVGTIVTATLTDPDGLGSVTSWQWARSTSRSTGWNDILGANSATYTPVGDDFRYYIRATALYEDGHDSGKSAAILSDNKVQAADTTNSAPSLGGDSRLTRAVAENTPMGGNVGSAVAARDPESDRLTYTISGNSPSPFGIDSTTGQIYVRTRAALDYESDTTEYKVTVSVHDGRDAYGNPDTTIDDSIEVTISVTNVDEAPVFTTAPSTVSYAENGIGAVANYYATDPEGATIIWSLSGIDAALFSIDEDGVLRFVSSPDYESPVDRDEDNKYDVTIQASDGTNDDSLKVSLEVTVTVSNVDEAGSVSLSPSQPRVNTELTASLTADPDGSVSVTSWQWTKSADRDNWSDIDGANTETYTPVANDLGHHLRATAFYTDGHGSGKSASVTSFYRVEAETTTNSAPSFGSVSSITRAVAENTPMGGNVGSAVAAMDPESDRLTYTISGNSPSPFGIDSTTGQIYVRTRAALDYESDTTEYTVTVSVLDGKDASGNDDNAIDDWIEVTISVTNVDEMGTVWLSSAQPRENTEITAWLTDPDDVKPIASWQWARSSDRAIWNDIPGAIFDKYTPVAGDLGYYLQVTVDYTDGHGADKSANAVTASTVVADSTDSQPEKPSPSPTPAPTRTPVAITVVPPHEVTPVPTDGLGTQSTHLIDPSRFDTITSADGSVSLTFPRESRDRTYQVTIDPVPQGCAGGAYPLTDLLLVCATVDLYSAEGVRESDVRLIRAASGAIRLTAQRVQELGGLPVLYQVYATGGVAILKRGDATDPWSPLRFELHTAADGGATVRIPSIRNFSSFALTINETILAQARARVAAAASPTPVLRSPTPTAVDQPPTPLPDVDVGDATAPLGLLLVILLAGLVLVIAGGRVVLERRQTGRR